MDASTVMSTFSSLPPETTAGASTSTLVKRPLALELVEGRPVTT